MDEKLLHKLQNDLTGELSYDHTMRTLYATDASAYREIPLAVAYPENIQDLKTLIEFANTNKTSIIPRTAGTSLAGQVVGRGVIVDVSKKFTKILEVNEKEQWVRVEPGVIRDELNMYLKEYGLYFGPETSTANRAMIGGMIGNNSCGSNSVVYGSTREHLISVKALLSNGTEVEFGEVSNEEFEKKRQLPSLEGKLYNNIHEILSDKNNQREIDSNFPKPSIQRRNTGYAIDLLRNMAPFKENKEPFNFCKLIAGSEGTLTMITEAKLSVQKLPPKFSALVCIHFNSIYDSLKGNLIALKYNPTACELMDNYILECTKNNINQRQNRFFVQGDPEAILVVELKDNYEGTLLKTAEKLKQELISEGLGYHFPVVIGSDTKKVWELRKAGLGLLSNIPGDAKPVPVIEDTAVAVEDLPDYINDFNVILKKHNLFCVHYAHAGSGELHLRPIIDLKTEEGNKLFRTILEEIAHLVKKYKGSLSGEHGDGRLRGEFIPFMIGDHNYRLLKQLKNTWDPNNILNPEKIVDTPSMNSSLRFKPGQQTKQLDTVFNFDETQGYLRAAEQCNGSGDCRKTHLSGGTMCPSYMATRDEKDSTRARANILREVITQSTKDNPFDSAEIKEVMDLCMSCKGCKSECPSNVDMGKLKAEFTHQYQKANGIPFRTKLIANFSKLNAIASVIPWAYNLTFNTPGISNLAKKVVGFHPDRSMPALSSTTTMKWYKKHQKDPLKVTNGKVYLFCDEFTNYNDGNIGITTIKLLNKLGYEVVIPKHKESGRTYLSKGVLTKAKALANKNVALLADIITDEAPLIGIEPSAILTFRDEYPDLVDQPLVEKAKKLASRTFTIEEFLLEALKKSSSQFTDKKKLIKLHGHCHQKAISSMVPTKKILSMPTNYEVQLIPSGCCGMAGSFGYENEHYDTSMKIGNLVLFPTIKKQKSDVIIAAPGTSCRHQIKDGTGRIALHPVEILYDALT